jgi:SAM-dependent methyltransferase
VSRGRILAGVERYYEERLRAHGATARGVDWASEDSQRLRFEQLLRLLPGGGGPFTVVDYGCGYGALAGYLRERGFAFSYRGFDISPAMVAEAGRLWGGFPAVSFVDREADLGPADYVLASGIFNVKLDTSDDEWAAYLRETLVRMKAIALEGLAFNVLSRYSDPPRRRADLYYADPLSLFDYCKTELSPRVALLHDYPLYEFTVLVRK